MRPQAEIEQIEISAITVQKSNPNDKYKIIGRIGAGAFGQVFKCCRKSDGYVNVLKHTTANQDERQSVVNEARLIKALNSEYLVSCEEIFDYDNKIWVYLELMDGGDFHEIIEFTKDTYSIDFCKYTLYMVAKGLQAMHD